MSDAVYEFEVGSVHGFRYFAVPCFDGYALWRRRPDRRQPKFLRLSETVDAARKSAEKDWDKLLNQCSETLSLF